MQTKLTRSKLFLALLVIILSFAVLTPVQAASIKESGSSTVTIQESHRNAFLTSTAGNRISGAYWQYTTDDHITGPAYCVNWGLTAVSPSKQLTIAGRYGSSPATMGAFAGGYPQRSLSDFLSINSGHPELSGLTEAEYAYATQLAVWATMGQLKVDGTTFTAGRATVARPSGDAQQVRIFSAMEIILSHAKNWTKPLYTGMYLRAEENQMGNTVQVPTGSTLAMAADSSQAGIRRETINGTEYFTREFTAASATSTYISGYAIDVWTVGAPDGTVFADTSNNILATGSLNGTTTYKVSTPHATPTTLNANGTEYSGRFKICIPAQDAPDVGQITIYIAAKIAQYDIYLAKNSVNSEQSYVIADPAYADISNRGMLAWGGAATGFSGITVLKTDGAGNPLADVEFELTNDDGFFAAGTTDQYGEITWDNLDADTTYTVTETLAPEGYDLAEPVEIEVTLNETSYVTIDNEESAGFRVRKIDAQNGSGLIDAVFQFDQIDGSFSTSATTGHDGLIEFTAAELPYGSYRVYEKTAPEGYKRDVSVQTVHWTGEADMELTFENVREPSLVIIKVDSEGYSLPNATFTVYKDGQPITTVTTDDAGYARVSGLSEGYYEVAETIPPAGYLLDSTRHGVHIDPYDPATEEDPVLVILNERKPALEISKVDPEGNPIAGAIFTVSKKDGPRIDDYVTNEAGKIFLTGLETGYYVITELSVPEPFILDTTPKEVYLVADEGAEIVVENQRLPDLTVNKVDSITGDAIAGALFRIEQILDSGSVEEVGKYYSDDNGQIFLSGLDVGWYRLTELEAAYGYAIQEPESQDIYLEANDQAEVTVENTPLSAIIIRKVDPNGEPLAGAQFQLRYLHATSGSGGTVIGLYTTGSRGTVVITGLDEGAYVVEELAAPEGYIRTNVEQTAYVSGDEQAVIELEFVNYKDGGVIIKKIDSTDPERTLSGAVFLITDSDGAVIGPNNGIYETDANGLISLADIQPETTLIVSEIKAPEGYVIDNNPQVVKVKADTEHLLTFTNTPVKGMQIVKLDEDSRRPIAGVEFSIAKMNGERIGTYRTNSDGYIIIPDLESGWYEVQETQHKDGYLPDDSIHNIEVKDGETAVLTVTNQREAGLLIQKIDSVTEEGIEGAKFLISDSGKNPIDTVVSDQDGYIYVDGLDDGKYYIREIDAPEGYILDTEPKTFYVEAGNTAEIVWENTPEMGQIQITKKSADYNGLNGLPAGTLLPGAVFEIYTRNEKLVDTVVTNKNGVAISETLPLGRYIIREITPPTNYTVLADSFEAEIEFSGQVARLEVLNRSVYTNVAVEKRGYAEVVPGQTMRYSFSNIANNSSVTLESFYWRDNLPTDAVRLQKLHTGTWSVMQNYKIIYKTNLSGDYRLLADNLVTTQPYTLDASPGVLGLAANEFVTEVMFSFGQVPAGFRQIAPPYVYCTVLPGLAHEYRFTNRTDVGGLYNGNWIMANDNWVTVVYNRTTPKVLPRTGY